MFETISKDDIYVVFGILFFVGAFYLLYLYLKYKIFIYYFPTLFKTKTLPVDSNSKEKIQKEPITKKKRKPPLAWAFSGGVFSGDIKGSNFGTTGLAVAILGAGKILSKRSSITDPEVYSNEMRFLAFVILLGLFLIGMGYYKYLTCPDSEIKD